MTVQIRSVALSLLALLALLFLLRYAQALFIPIALSMLVAYALDPIVGQMERLRIPRTLAAAFVLLGMLGTAGYGMYALRYQVIGVIDSLPEAARKMQARIEELRKTPADPAGALTKIQQAAKEIEQTAAETAGGGSASGVTKVQIQEPPFRANDYLWIGSLGLVGLIAQAILILFLVFFLLASGDLFKRKLVQIIGTKLSEKRVTLDTLNEINTHVGRYLLVQVATGAIVGLCTGVALWALGLKQPVVWGIAAGVLNSVPYFGAIIVIAGLSLVAFLQFDSISMTLQVAAVATLINTLESLLFTPWLMGRVSRINGVAMFVSLLFWSWLWGVIGLIVAIPITMVIKSVCDRIEGLQAIGNLLDEA